MDVRFLPNPHWVDELRRHTGQHPAVREYVLGQPGAAEFLDTYKNLVAPTFEKNDIALIVGVVFKR